MRSALGTRYTEQGMRAAGSLSLRPCFACVCPAAAPAARLPGCPLAHRVAGTRRPGAVWLLWLNLTPHACTGCRGVSGPSELNSCADSLG